MGHRRVCNGEYKSELSEANKGLVPDYIDHRVESGSSSATESYSRTCSLILESSMDHMISLT